MHVSHRLTVKNIRVSGREKEAQAHLLASIPRIRNAIRPVKKLVLVRKLAERGISDLLVPIQGQKIRIKEHEKKSILSSDSKVSSQSSSKSPSKDRGSYTHQTRKSASRKDKNTLHKASRSRTKQPTRRRSSSKKRSTSHEKTPRKSSPSPSPARSTSTEGNCRSSTVSSSSDDEGDEKTGSVRSWKHLLKPPKFDGTQSFEAFWAHFRNCAEYNRWDRKDRLIFLRNSLEAEAANVLWDYSEEVTTSLSRLTATLKQRFGGQAFVDKHRTELRSRCRGKNETSRSLHADIR